MGRKARAEVRRHDAGEAQAAQCASVRAPGAGLASVAYRMTQNFTAVVGMAGFFGHYQTNTPPLYVSTLGNDVGRGAYKEFTEQGFAPVRARDELYLRIRYAF